MRGQGARPPLLLHPTEARRAGKKLRSGPPLSQGLGDRSPSPSTPPSLPEGMDPSLVSYHHPWCFVRCNNSKSFYYYFPLKVTVR